MNLIKTVTGRDSVNDFKFEVLKDGHLYSLHGYKNNDEKTMFTCHVVDDMKKINSIINSYIIFDRKTHK